MNPKLKKALIYSGLGLDIVVTVFLFVISIIMLASMPEKGTDMELYYKANPGFITYLQYKPTVYLLACVVPLVVLLVGNIVLLVLYISKSGKRKAELSDLSEEQKAALRAEILKDMEAPQEEKKSSKKK